MTYKDQFQPNQLMGTSSIFTIFNSTFSWIVLLEFKA